MPTLLLLLLMVNCAPVGELELWMTNCPPLIPLPLSVDPNHQFTPPAAELLITIWFAPAEVLVATLNRPSGLFVPMPTFLDALIENAGDTAELTLLMMNRPPPPALPVSVDPRYHSDPPLAAFLMPICGAPALVVLCTTRFTSGELVPSPIVPRSTRTVLLPESVSEIPLKLPARRVLVTPELICRSEAGVVLPSITRKLSTWTSSAPLAINRWRASEVGTPFELSVSMWTCELPSTTNACPIRDTVGGAEPGCVKVPRLTAVVLLEETVIAFSNPSDPEAPFVGVMYTFATVTSGASVGAIGSVKLIVWFPLVSVTRLDSGLAVDSSESAEELNCLCQVYFRK